MGIPHADIFLENTILKRKIEVKALFDSGSVFMTVPQHVAVQLGFDLDEVSTREAVPADGTNEASISEINTPGMGNLLSSRTNYAATRSLSASWASVLMLLPCACASMASFSCNSGGIRRLNFPENWRRGSMPFSLHTSRKT